MFDAAAATADGEFEKARNLTAQAMKVEPRLSRRARNAPKTIAEMLPLLRRKEVGGPVMRQLRQSLGLSQYQLAEICGVRQGNVAHWEGGRQAISEEPLTRLIQWMGDRVTKTIGDGPLPAALLKLRTELGLSHVAIAAKLDLKDTVVRRMETGNMVISIDAAERYRELAADYGFDLNELAA